MERRRVIPLLVWATGSALFAGGLVFLGANTAPFQSQWPAATATGGLVGGAAGLVAYKLWGSRRGLLLLAIPFGLIQAVIAGYVLWGLK